MKARLIYREDGRILSKLPTAEEDIKPNTTP